MLLAVVSFSANLSNDPPVIFELPKVSIVKHLALIVPTTTDVPSWGRFL